jgi:hypothetical protein
MTLDFGLHGAGGESQDCMASDWLLWGKTALIQVAIRLFLDMIWSILWRMQMHMDRLDCMILDIVQKLLVPPNDLWP